MPEQVVEYSTDAMPDGGWTEWRKKVTTRMIRIDGPFVAHTQEGPLRCLDGWLAVDARGYPYPIAVEDQVLMYEPVGDDNA